MIKQNEGSTDRIIRIIIGTVFLGVGLFGLTGVSQIIALVIGGISLLTGIIGFCGLYTLLGISTRPVKK